MEPLAPLPGELARRSRDWEVVANLQLPVVSDGPFFSVLPEKKGEKRGAWLRLVLPASEFSRVPRFQTSFHTIVTSRASWYAPPDM